MTTGRVFETVPNRYSRTPVYIQFISTTETGVVRGFRRTYRKEPAGSTRHTVKQGETLQDIALGYYFAPEYWHILADYNLNVLDPLDIDDLVGQRIIVPPRSVL